MVNWINMARKSVKHLRTTHRNTGQLLFGVISRVYYDLHYWRLNQQSQIAEPKL